MKLVLLLCAITFVVFISSAVLISFCKRRTRNSKHSLTGMCHEDGGCMCSGCAEPQEKLQPFPTQK